MKIRNYCMVGIVCLSIWGVTIHAEETQAGGKYADTLPEFSLKDPVGKDYSSQSLAENGVVIVVTAPIRSNKNAQRGWDQQLKKEKGNTDAKWVFLEDMTPSRFKKIALNRIKKAYKSGREPILLIDPNGEVRKKFQVKQKETVVLVYDQTQKLVASEAGAPSAAAAQKIWAAVK